LYQMKKILGVLTSALVLCSAFTGCSTGNSSSQTNQTAQSNNYPNSPVTVVVPFSAGGGTDLTIRALVEAVKSEFPKNITVENRTGGGGAVGLSYGAHAKADGSVITAVTVELTTLPHMGASGGVSYDQFKPILMYNSDQSVITVRADAPWKTLKDFVEYSKTNKVQIGNSGVGAIWHLAAAGLAKAAGTQFTYVPFDGAMPAITSLLGDHIQAVSVSYPEVMPHVKSGELRVLAVLGDKRLEELPDVPTAKEAGYDVSIGTWRGLAVPKDTPDSVVEKLSEIFSKGLQSESFKNYMAKSNEPITYMDSKDFASKIEKDDSQFKTLIDELGIAKK
jgi:tripartite-type tricarboxylate transporter receptor subunit TctC